jgi:hypothetical protein
MIAFNGHVLRFLHIINTFQDSKAMAYTGNTHRLEVIVQQCHKSFSYDFVFCSPGTDNH